MSSLVKAFGIVVLLFGVDFVEAEIDSNIGRTDLDVTSASSRDRFEIAVRDVGIGVKEIPWVVQTDFFVGFFGLYEN